jgi:hypothetical protein
MPGLSNSWILKDRLTLEALELVMLGAGFLLALILDYYYWDLLKN